MTGRGRLAPVRPGGVTLPPMRPDLTWHDLNGHYTPDWWALHAGTERLALVQPFDGRASIVFYIGNQPWKQKQVTAGSVRQGKRFAERWLASRLRPMAS